MTEADLEQARARSAFTAAQGLQWVERKQAELDALPTRTVVVIDIKTGDYVTGKTLLEACDLFDQSFGAATPGFIHRVRDRSFI